MIEFNGLSKRLLNELQLIKSHYPALVEIADKNTTNFGEAIIHSGCSVILKYYDLDDGFRFELGSHLSECFGSTDYITMLIS